jgi:hypothetical protein
MLVVCVDSVRPFVHVAGCVRCAMVTNGVDNEPCASVAWAADPLGVVCCRFDYKRLEQNYFRLRFCADHKHLACLSVTGAKGIAIWTQLLPTVRRTLPKLSVVGVLECWPSQGWPAHSPAAVCQLFCQESEARGCRTTLVQTICALFRSTRDLALGISMPGAGLQPRRLCVVLCARMGSFLRRFPESGLCAAVVQPCSPSVAT